MEVSGSVWKCVEVRESAWESRIEVERVCGKKSERAEETALENTDKKG